MEDVYNTSLGHILFGDVWCLFWLPWKAFQDISRKTQSMGCNRASWPRVSNVIVIVIIVVIVIVIIVSVIICILLLAEGGSHREGMGSTLRHGHLARGWIGTMFIHFPAVQFNKFDEKSSTITDDHCDFPMHPRSSIYLYILYIR